MFGAALLVALVGVVWLSVVQWQYATGGGVVLWLMVALGLAASVVGFVSYSPAGSALVISPTVSFTFAIMLSWGLGPAIATQLVAVAMVAWLRRLPVLDAAFSGLRMTVAFLAAALVMVVGDPGLLPAGIPAANLRDAGVALAAMVAWLVTYGATLVITARLGQVGRAVLSRSLWYTLLFNAALIGLSPVLSDTAQTSPAFLPLLLVSLFAVQVMARLAAERDRLAELDPLTGLANRALLRRRFDEWVVLPSRAQRPDQVALVVLDLDRFKQINDSLGHEVGDQLLMAVAQRLRLVEEDDVTVGRLGGDEFAILARVEGTSAAAALAHRALQFLEGPVRLDGLRLDSTASAGVGIGTDSADTFTTVLRKADTAMYEAKRQGGTVVVFGQDRSSADVARLQLLADLRDALDAPQTHQIALHYQVQVNLRTGAVEGAEALFRWTHPTQGPIGPATIISIAEYTTVMSRLTAFVVDQATAQSARWRDQGVNVRVAINLSARDLHSDTIVGHIADRLHRPDLDPGRLQVEVTESALMADPSRANTTLSRIAELGVAISLDDFGTGYSSLQHLRRLPLKEIKIDRSFVATMASNHDDRAIVVSTVDMAHALGMRTVAEGVSDEETLHQLTETGCDVGQGWLFGAAGPADEVTELVLHPQPTHG